MCTERREKETKIKQNTEKNTINFASNNIFIVFASMKTFSQSFLLLQHNTKFIFSSVFLLLLLLFGAKASIFIHPNINIQQKLTNINDNNFCQVDVIPYQTICICRWAITRDEYEIWRNDKWIYAREYFHGKHNNKNDNFVAGAHILHISKWAKRYG